MNDVMIIANPSSGRKNAEEYAEKVKKALMNENRESVIKLTEKKEDISAFAKQASSEAYSSIIVIGGDGTVSELADGLYDQKYRPTIGIIPAGTVNNISRGLDIPNDPVQVVNELTDYIEKKADAGKVNDRIFLQFVSAGPVPETVWEVSAEQKEKYGQAAYFMEGMKSLGDEETYKMDLQVDEEHLDVDLNLILIGVNGSIAGIPNFFDDARIDDGKLYLFGLKRSSIGQKLTVLREMIFNERPLNKTKDIAFTLSFKKAVISVEKKEAYAAVDGEKGPAFPIILEVLPQYFTFLVPAEDQSSGQSI
ncbi:MAG: diacylglycerol kinase family protein [Alkalibacterium sp.]|nr:diacylglycerol kinase family protein [Alkalibacterium sp.]